MKRLVGELKNESQNRVEQLIEMKEREYRSN